MTKYKIDRNGFYGVFGGAYIPEMLKSNVEELEDSYLDIVLSESFKSKYTELLKEYVGRPSPLSYSEYFSDSLKAKVFLKREDLNHTGSHKINNTIGQILLARELGKKTIIAETGAGQHGVATATVCALLDMDCTVFMGERDMERQLPNVSRMKMLGARVVPAETGSKTLKDATNEALRYWIQHPESYYLIGSVVGPHPYPDMVNRFQSVISEEIILQLKEKTGKSYPDYVIACVGGGSNAAGAFYHFLEQEEVRLLAVEAAGLGIESGQTAATIQVGTEGVIHGSRTLLMQDEYGQIVEPYSVSAGLDYPGIGPLHAHLYRENRVEYLAVSDEEALEAGLLLTRKEGILPAIESAHALALLKKYSFNKESIIVVNLSGRGDKDMDTYIRYVQGKEDE